MDNKSRFFLGVSSMIRLLLRAVLVCLPLMVAGRALAEDTPKAILDRAIKAHGADKFEKLKAAQTSGKGTVDVAGMTLSFTSEGSAQLPDKFKSILHMDIGGMKITQVQTMNGDKITLSVNGMAQNITDELRKIFKEQDYADLVSTLLPLKDKGFELALAGEANVDGKPAVGIKVKSKDKPDITLYFDKKTDLLVKSEHRATDPMSNQEYTQASSSVI